MEEFLVEKVIELILNEIKEFKEKNELTIINNDIYNKMQKLLRNKVFDEKSYDLLSNLFFKLQKISVANPDLQIFGDKERTDVMNSIIKQLDIYTISLVGKNKIQEMVNLYFDLLESQLKNLFNSSDIILLNQIKNNEMYIKNILEILKQKEIKEPGYKDYYKYWNYVSKSKISHLKKYELNNHTGELPSRLEENWVNFIKQESWISMVKSNISILNELLDEIDEIYYDEYELLKAYSINIALLSNCSDETYIDLCNYLCDQFEKLKKLINAIPFDDNDDISTFHEVLKVIGYIETKVLSKSFGKCFCITGRIGSGKTHFINHIIQNYTYMPYSTSNERCFFIYISADGNTDTSLENLVVKHLKMSNDDDITLNSINEYLQNEKIRLIIIIDNMQALDKNRMENLQNSITESTKYEMLYWVLSIRENNLYNENNETNDTRLDHIIRDYGLTEYDYITNPTQEKEEEKHFYIGKWLSIDQCNIESRIYLEILDSSINRIDMDEKKYLVKNIESLEPLIIWFIKESIPDLNNLIDLVYFDFVRIFWFDRRNKLIDIAKAKSYLGELQTEKEIDAVIQALTKYVTNNHTVTFYEDSIELQNIATLLHVLYEGNFIKIDKNKILTYDIFHFIGKKYELDYQIIWAYACANYFISNDKSRDLLSKLIDLKNHKFEISQEIIEFILILEGSNHQMRSDWIESFINEPSLWLAATKTNECFSECLINHLKNKEVDRNIIFYVMYFLKHKSHLLSLEDIVKILQKYYININDQYLIDYFIHIIECKISTVNNINDIFDSLKFFIGCEIFDDSLSHDQLLRTKTINEIAKSLATRIFSIENLPVQEYINYLLQYTVLNNSEILGNEHNRNDIKIYPGVFYECFYCHFCKIIIRKRGAYDAYKLFKNMFSQITYNSLESFLWISKAMNLEIGRFYRDVNIGYIDDWTKDNIKKLIKYLLSSNDAKELCDCFYIIKHTINYEERYHAKLDRFYKNSLKQLLNMNNSILEKELQIQSNIKFIEYQCKKAFYGS